MKADFLPLSRFAPVSFAASIACALVLLACAGKQPANPGDPAAEKPAARTPFEQGRVLYAARCDGCHVLPVVEAHSPENWERILRRMKVEADLTPAEEHRVRAYLVAASAWRRDSLGIR